jgi:HEAT repeat protein
LKIKYPISALFLVLFSVAPSIIAAGQTAGLSTPSASELVKQFKSETFFWKQFEVAKEIVALGNKSVLPELGPYLSDEDMHARGNAAFIFAALGDDRGFEILKAILEDRSSKRKIGPGIATGTPNPAQELAQEIESDRYYAAHLFGDLKDPRAVPLLIPLLEDEGVNRIVPWALGQIGDKSAIPPLIKTLHDTNPDMRVLAIYALEQFNAKQALPEIRTLLGDHEKIHFDGAIPVSEAAKNAIIKLEQKPLGHSQALAR